MLVYVLSKDGQPLMPTERCGKVRRMLKSGMAKVIKRCPFTIQLQYETTDHVQPVSLGVDAGYKHIGLSATTETKELYASDVELRTDIVELLSTRREARRARRNRKTRYRKPRFLNRTRSKHKGWLAPSVEQRVACHLTAVARVCRILPVSSITVETASFDTQLLKAEENGTSLPIGTDYQRGEQMGFWNVREYVLFRDGHMCRCCKGKSKDPVLNVHHLVSRKTGGNRPENLVTLCETCHERYHKGLIKLPDDITAGNGFKEAAFMGISRWTVYNRLKEIYPNVHMTYGYITKNIRIENGLPKDHYIDARCISGNPTVKAFDYVYYQKKIRCHNRQMYKFNTSKGGIRKANQAPYEVKGFRLFDKVKANNNEWYINGRRQKGAFVLKNLQNETIEIVPSKIQLINIQRFYIIERRLALLS